MATSALRICHVRERAASTPAPPNGPAHINSMVFRQGLHAAILPRAPRQPVAAARAGTPHPRQRPRIANAPDWTRTNDLRFRKPPLYPAELREHGRRIWGQTARCSLVSVRDQPRMASCSRVSPDRGARPRPGKRLISRTPARSVFDVANLGDCADEWVVFRILPSHRDRAHRTSRTHELCSTAIPSVSKSVFGIEAGMIWAICPISIPVDRVQISDSQELAQVSSSRRHPSLTMIPSPAHAQGLPWAGLIGVLPHKEALSVRRETRSQAPSKERSLTDIFARGGEGEHDGHDSRRKP